MADDTYQDAMENQASQNIYGSRFTISEFIDCVVSSSASAAAACKYKPQ
jgi:hypothetical protein